MTTAPALPSLTSYSPRQFGERLDPPRSGQWVLVRIWGGEYTATKTGRCWRLSHQELRRVSGQDLAWPGHEVPSGRDERVRELNARLARLGAAQAQLGYELAQCVALAAEMEG